MKQKLFFVSLLYCLFTLTLSAQTEKGKFTLSGRSSLDFAYLSNRIYGDEVSIGDKESLNVDGYSFNIAPSLSYFIIDNLMVGGEISYTLSDGDYQTKSSQLILMPMVAYYLPTGKPVRPFVAAGVGYANISMEMDLDAGETATKSFGGFTWAGGVGAAFFVSHNISIDLMAQYAEVSARYSDDSSMKYSTIGLGGTIGLSVYF